MMYDLQCRYDARKSFYGKARVMEQTMTDWKEIDLYSYNTLVARVLETEKTKKYIYNGYYSQTTTRHQKEFFRQLGLTDREIKELFKRGVLVIEYNSSKF